MIGGLYRTDANGQKNENKSEKNGKMKNIGKL